ncbi:MAG: Jag N-terminal domain-containing protein [Candidatus Omnitrophica bacterium]|nr:Jag N-terminal domain-containing protein [Candidatus Omnitrophota bacterium]
MTPGRRRSITAEGRTVKEAIEKGLSLLGVSRERVAVKVLSEESRGLFGMRGAKGAKIRLTLKTE